MKISATIITLNEAEKIANAITSLPWADEVLVIDSGSTDQTRDIARSLGAKVIENDWPGFPAQKNFAAKNAENDWIFSLDADEVVSEELKKALITLKSMPEASLADGYRIPRLSFYMGRAIRHSGWYPDSQLRLYNRNKGKWKDVLIHESVEIVPGGSTGRLSGDILHYSVENAAHHHRMIGERYAPLAARQMLKNGRRTSLLKIITAAPVAFLQTYFLKAGFLDGLPGFVIAKFAAHHAFLKHVMLWEMQQNNRS